MRIIHYIYDHKNNKNKNVGSKLFNPLKREAIIHLLDLLSSRTISLNRERLASYFHIDFYQNFKFIPEYW